MRRQSEHIADYRAAIDRLAAMGLVYPAFMSRGEVARRHRRHRLAARPGRGAALSARTTASATRPKRQALIDAGAPHALRLDMEKAADMAGPLDWQEDGFGAPQTVAADPRAFGDVLLVGRDRPASYHIAVVVDDALQGVTHVVRGRDLYRRDLGACAPAAPARPARAALPPSPADHRCLRPQALQVRPRHGACRLRAAGKTPDDIRRMVGL